MDSVLHVSYRGMCNTPCPQLGMQSSRQQGSDSDNQTVIQKLEGPEQRRQVSRMQLLVTLQPTNPQTGVRQSVL